MAERETFRRKAGTLGRILTRDDPILNVLDSMVNRLRSLKKHPPVIRKSPRAGVNHAPANTFLAAFAVPSLTPAHTSSPNLPFESDDDDSLLPLLSKNARIPNALSDEKYLLNSSFIDDPELRYGTDEEDTEVTEIAAPALNVNGFVSSSVFFPSAQSAPRYGFAMTPLKQSMSDHSLPAGLEFSHPTPYPAAGNPLLPEQIVVEPPSQPPPSWTMFSPVPSAVPSVSQPSGVSDRQSESLPYMVSAPPPTVVRVENETFDGSARQSFSSETSPHRRHSLPPPPPITVQVPTAAVIIEGPRTQTTQWRYMTHPSRIGVVSSDNMEDVRRMERPAPSARSSPAWSPQPAPTVVDDEPLMSRGVEHIIVHQRPSSSPARSRSSSSSPRRYQPIVVNTDQVISVEADTRTSGGIVYPRSRARSRSRSYSPLSRRHSQTPESDLRRQFDRRRPSSPSPQRRPDSPESFTRQYAQPIVIQPRHYNPDGDVRQAYRRRARFAPSVVQTDPALRFESRTHSPEQRVPSLAATSSRARPRIHIVPGPISGIQAAAAMLPKARKVRRPKQTWERQRSIPIPDATA